MRLLKLIVKTVSTLRNGQRFSLIGVVLGIPIVVITLIFMTELNEEINWTNERLRGVKYSELLKDLLQEVQQHRAYSMSYMKGEQSSHKKLEDKQKDITKTLWRINQYDKELTLSGNNIEKISQLNHQWDEIVNSIRSSHSGQDAVQQDKYILFIIDFIEHIASKCSLILTKEKFNYYLIKDIVKTLPLLTEQLGKIRKIAVSAENELTNQEIQQIISLKARTERFLEELEHSRNISNMNDISNERNFDALSDTVIEETYNFLDSVKNDFLNEQLNTDFLNEFVNHATKVINLSFELHDLETLTLKSIMGEQIKKMKLARIFVFVLLVIAGVLTIYCFLGFYFSIRCTIKKVKKEEERVKNKYISTQKKLKQVEKRMSFKVMKAHEEERKKVSRDLHDGIGQSLYSILIKLNVISEQISEKKQKQDLREVMKIAENTMKEIRRISHSLRPGVLDDFGFIPAIKSCIDGYKEIHNLHVEFKFIGDQKRLEPEIETHLYRICQEALTNVAKHAAAKSVYVLLKVSEQDILLTLKDDGKGFFVDDKLTGYNSEGIGLYSMKERAESLGGKLVIRSKEGYGTEVSILIPK